MIASLLHSLSSKSKLLFTFALCTISVKALSFSNPFNHHKSPITRLTIVGERCSGTNFITQLMLKNFPNLTYTNAFGHKHFLWWFGTPADEEKMKLLDYNLKCIDLKDSDDCLFVFIIRDPYDWLRSFFYKPHHVHRDLLSQGFFHFISHTWKPADFNNYGGMAFNLIDELNPFTDRPFQNILELRTSKNKNYLKMGTMVKNFLFVRYEDAATHPKKLIRFIATYYNLQPSSEFIPITNYKGLSSSKTYKKQIYFPLTHQSLRFINDNLDWESENQLGYTKKEAHETPWTSNLIAKLKGILRWCVPTSFLFL